MKRASIIGVATAIALGQGAASATTYYVRASGNNSNSGTSAGQAWRTVAYAVDHVAAGDTVYVGAGTYGENITPSGDGTSGSRILVVADTSGSRTGDAGLVILRRSGTVLDMSGDDYWTFRGFMIDCTDPSQDVINVSSCAGAAFESCTITGGRDGLDTDNGSITIDGCEFGSIGDDAVNADGGTLTITSCTFDNITDDALRFETGASFTIDACEILDGSTGIWVNGADGTVTNTLIADGDMDDGIAVNNSNDDVFVINCTFWGMDGDGIDGDAGDTTVRNCVFSDIGDNCLEGTSSEIDGNTNLFWQHGGSRSSGFDSSNELSYDPQFADEGGGDFSLASGSSAIDAGLDMSSYTSVDIDGGARPAGGGWDLGAYEYGSAVHAAADVPYSTDFSSVGDEWVGAISANNGTVGDYIGRYGKSGGVQASTSLYLNTTPGSTYTLTFDLLTIDSWDGDHTSYGPDAFEVLIDGATAFDETLAHYYTSYGQSYPYPADAVGNWGWDGGYQDGRYNDVTVTFVATDTETEITFIGDASEDIGNESWGLIAVGVDETMPVFVDVSSATGFSVDSNGGMHNGSGLSWADLDNDGDLDCFVGGDSNYVMGNALASGTFTSIGVGSYDRQVALADVDGDGDYDIAACPQSPAAVLETFSGFLLARGALGIDGPSNAEGAVAADVDGDGDTDLLFFAENGNWIALNMGAGHDGHSPVGFVDAKSSSDGMNDPGDAGNGDYVSSADVNDDGYLDFFYRYITGRLFLSNADGTFTENASGISVFVNNSYKSGSAWGDYDNDGDMDLFVPDARPGNAGTLWRNDSGVFTDVASSAGVTATVEMRGACWGDYDNDGDLDLYVTTASGGANLLYSNDGDGTFTLDDFGSGLTDDYEDACFVDFDNDGDLDLALTRRDGDGKTRLLENQTDDANYLKVRPLGPSTGGSNIQVVGARVELLDAAGTTVLARREIGTARGFAGTEPVWAHFGGVNPAGTYTVRVTWPGGDQQSAEVVPATASTTIGSTTVAQMLTIEQQPSGVKFVRWREVSPVD